MDSAGSSRTILLAFEKPTTRKASWGRGAGDGKRTWSLFINGDQPCHHWWTNSNMVGTGVASIRE